MPVLHFYWGEPYGNFATSGLRFTVQPTANQFDIRLDPAERLLTAQRLP